MRVKQGKYYTTEKIDKTGAYYRMIVSERSDGKTYSVLMGVLKKFVKNGEQLAYIRRNDKDFIGKRGTTLFENLINNDEIRKASDGKWDTVIYRSRMWFLARRDGDELVVCEKPIAYGFALTDMEHDKSTAYPNITTVLFDEFISRFGYLTDEFVIFTNVLSTIIRDRNNVVIYMCGNTVNKFCPYFNEMGLKNIKKQKQGTIDLYRYGESNLTVAVEYSAGRGKEGKPSDVYFAFDNPKLKMITSGEWELNVYPRSPIKIRPKDVMFSYFIHFDFEWVQCDVVATKELSFTHIHPCNEPKNKDVSVIFSPEFSANPRHFRLLTRPTTPIHKKLFLHYETDRVFYSDNDTGELVRNYLLWCGRDLEV